MANPLATCHGTDGIAIWGQHYYQIPPFCACVGRIAHHCGGVCWAKIVRWPLHLSKGSWSLQKRQHTQWYILYSAIAKQHLITLCLMLSFDYHWEHDVETSLSNNYNNVQDHMPLPRLGFCLVVSCWRAS